MDQIKPTCNAEGADGLRCFLLHGHNGKHRSAKIVEWAMERLPDAQISSDFGPDSAHGIAPDTNKYGVQND